MKISRNILVSSMALAGITLGALAPVTVQAATTGVGTVDGKFSALDKGKYVDLNKGEAAYATDSISANAHSEASVEVVSGFLSLDAVPDFSFGRAVEGKTANLLNGQSAIPNDGNQDGLLQVTESRKVGGNPESPAAANAGFTLSAQLGQFDNGVKTSKDFKLNLTSQPLRSADDGAPAKSIMTSPVTLNASGAGKNILDVSSEKALFGTYKVLFNSNDSASLFVPEGTSNENGVSKWSGVITWTLNAKAGATPASTTPDTNAKPGESK
ncbi:WxL domain-containing protein [Companilactobacillus zhongbaensis]|uniref:WxL domain-containing protein n=1 Tax=Companilactobacillus zhongbaensis TaxID=2486009 RepID=UPI000F770CFF|nr:WxL domain-containing protein [Companilactobacillus zhongbaensis]